MMKFYIEKKNERDGEVKPYILEFETHHELEDFLAYNRAYIKKMQTLDEDTTYSFADVTTGEEVRG